MLMLISTSMQRGKEGKAVGWDGVECRGGWAGRAGGREKYHRDGTGIIVVRGGREPLPTLMIFSPLMIDPITGR